MIFSLIYILVLSGGGMRELKRHNHEYIYIYIYFPILFLLINK
jgi:hypothetical protein